MFRLKFRRLGNRASAAVELALVSVFFLLPLFGGGVDFVEIMSAQAQVNTALRSLYSYAWTNAWNYSNIPPIANTAPSNYSQADAIITLINASSLTPLSFPNNTVAVPEVGSTSELSVANGSSYYVCIPTSGNTVTQASTCPAPGYTQQVWVVYQVSSTVFLPVPMPGLTRNGRFTVTATREVQIE